MVIDDDHGDELLRRRYQGLGAALDAAVARARRAGLVAVRRMGIDPAQVRVIRSVVARLGSTPDAVRFELTGAWVHAHDGCVVSVRDALASLGFEAALRDSALRLD